MPRDLLSLSYVFVFQLFTLTSLTNEQGETSGNVMGYGNTLELSYGHLFSHRLQLGLSNRFQQGTETVNVSGFVSSGGEPVIGQLTTGAKHISNALEVGLHYQLAQSWGLATRAESSFFTGYDLSDSPRVIPPPLGVAVGGGVDLQRGFSIGQLALSTGYGYVTELRDQTIPQNEIFPPSMSTMSAGLSLAWRHQLNPLWDYSVDAGVDMRLMEQFWRDPSDGSLINLGYNVPEFSPSGGASLRFRWENFLQISLSYGHRLQRQLENQVSTVSNVDQVGLDLYLIHKSWRLDLFGAFRYAHNTSREVDSDSETEDLGATTEGLARAAVIYVVRPEISLELSYQLEVVGGQQNPTLDQANQLQVRSTDYALQLVTLGVSLAWPPPPPEQPIEPSRQRAHAAVQLQHRCWRGRSAGAWERDRRRPALDAE